MSLRRAGDTKLLVRIVKIDDARSCVILLLLMLSTIIFIPAPDPEAAVASKRRVLKENIDSYIQFIFKSLNETY